MKEETNIETKQDNINRTILVAGNGFDIALGLKTKYGDFFTVIFLILALDKYENYFNCYNFTDVRNKTISILDKIETLFPVSNAKLSSNSDESFRIKTIDLKKLTEIALTWYVSNDFEIESFKQAIQKPLFFNFVERILKKLTIYVVDKTTSNSSWKPDFSQEDLFRYQKSNFNGFMEFKSYKDFERFIYIVDSYIKSANYSGWMDLEQFIELLVTGNEYLENKYFKNYNFKYLHNEHSVAQLYSNGLEHLCILFEKYISLINSYIPDNYDINSLFSSYLVSFNNRNPNEKTSLLNINNVVEVFDYNYTESCRKLFPESVKVYYVNGKVNGNFLDKRKKSKIVFGYTRNNKQFNVGPKCLVFEKNKQRFIKNIELYDYEKIVNEGCFNVIIFGHSCSPADGDVIGCLLSSSNLNKAVICCYNEDVMISIYENLVQILDDNQETGTTINKLIINKKVLFCVHENG